MIKHYSFLAKKTSKQIHIFETKKVGNIDCVYINNPQESECGNVVNTEVEAVQRSVAVNLLCMNENEARKKAAEIGRIVCGQCVSTLYADPE